MPTCSGLAHLLEMLTRSSSAPPPRVCCRHTNAASFPCRARARSLPSRLLLPVESEPRRPTMSATAGPTVVLSLFVCCHPVPCLFSSIWCLPRALVRGCAWLIWSRMHRPTQRTRARDSEKSTRATGRESAVVRSAGAGARGSCCL